MMKCFLRFLGLGLIMMSALCAHIVEQLYVSVLEEAAVEEGLIWRGEVYFDAGYALAEMRDDEDSLQPERSWLVGLSEGERAEVCAGAEFYLRECLSFKQGGEELSYEISFIDYESDPPDFLVMHNGGAYLRVEVAVTMDGEKAEGLQVRVTDGKYPNFVFNREGEEARGPRYEVVKPSGELSLGPFLASEGEDKDRGLSRYFSWSSLLWLGWEHVISWDGLDHSLLILGLFLLVRDWRALLAQSLVFTVAHSLTLGLAVAGLLTGILEWLGPWVEALIALSIAFVALENFYRDRVSVGRLGLVFFFGLLHGLGFAGSLGASLGQSEQWLSALFLANVGIELGQVAILALAWLLTMRWWETAAYEKFRKGASLAIAAVGLFWMVERLL